MVVRLRQPAAAAFLSVCVRSRAQLQRGTSQAAGCLATAFSLRLPLPLRSGWCHFPSSSLQQVSSSQRAHRRQQQCGRALPHLACSNHWHASASSPAQWMMPAPLWQLAAGDALSACLPAAAMMRQGISLGPSWLAMALSMRLPPSPRSGWCYFSSSSSQQVFSSQRAHRRQRQCGRALPHLACSSRWHASASSPAQWMMPTPLWQLAAGASLLACLPAAAVMQLGTSLDPSWLAAALSMTLPPLLRGGWCLFPFSRLQQVFHSRHALWRRRQCSRLL